MHKTKKYNILYITITIYQPDRITFKNHLFSIAVTIFIYTTRCDLEGNLI